MAIVLSVILFGIAAFWMYRFSQKSLDARKQLICFYGAEIVCLWLSMCFFVHAFSTERVMPAKYDHIIYVSALFLFPFLHLVFLCAMKGKTLMRTTIMKHTLPHIVIALLNLAIYFAIEQGLRIPDSVSRVLIIVFKGLLFCSVMVYSSLFVFRYAFYRRLVKRIFSDATQTDFPIVSRIGGIAMAEGVVMYMMLCRGFLNLEGDWLALLILWYFFGCRCFIGVAYLIIARNIRSQFGTMERYTPLRRRIAGCRVSTSFDRLSKSSRGCNCKYCPYVGNVVNRCQQTLSSSRFDNQ